jgi:hypothetical protein
MKSQNVGFYGREADSQLQPKLLMKIFIYIETANNNNNNNNSGALGTVVVKALCYKSKGRGFDTR